MIHADERDSERVRALREQFHRELEHLDANKTWVVDESGASCGMTRLRGRAPQGERVHGSVPGGHWKVQTIVGALRTDGMGASLTFEGATDGEAFLTFVKKILGPKLSAGDVVVLDNLSSHKVAGVSREVEKQGARLLYLPPYSPDFSPIEPAWSKLKQFLRSAAARTKEALEQAIANGLRTITSSDACGYFRKCGYAVT
ncbi:MAG TPA: IS630 family transposase [Myxococcaceae bacterium]|nr:IS630 family transposase [Myxococcaceae bacterium]